MANRSHTRELGLDDLLDECVEQLDEATARHVLDRVEEIRSTAGWMWERVAKAYIRASLRRPPTPTARPCACNDGIVYTRGVANPCPRCRPVKGNGLMHEIVGGI